MKKTFALTVFLIASLSFAAEKRTTAQIVKYNPVLSFPDMGIKKYKLDALDTVKVVRSGRIQANVIVPLNSPEISQNPIVAFTVRMGDTESVSFMLKIEPIIDFAYTNVESLKIHHGSDGQRLSVVLADPANGRTYRVHAHVVGYHSDGHEEVNVSFTEDGDYAFTGKVDVFVDRVSVTPNIEGDP